MIPVSIVTGFLGSGKTSFIKRVLTERGFGQTAVIVNEFGEISLDHDLIASSDDSILTLNTGCLCCAVQTDLAKTLLDLEGRRQRSEVTFDRILIETSGLANPAPMLQAIMNDRAVAATHRIGSVLTVADSVHGEQNLAGHAEARIQIALADVILVSKQDVQPLSPALRAAVRRLNPDGAMVATGEASIATLFGLTKPERFRPLPDIATSGHTDVETFTVVRDRPLRALSLTLLLQAIAEHCSGRLLRLKGLVAIDEVPGQPALIHGVHHVFSTPEFLDRWPTSDRSSRIVFIGKDIPRYFIGRLLDVIEEEVRDMPL